MAVTLWLTAALAADGQLQYRFEGNGFKGQTLQLVPRPEFEGEQLRSLSWRCASEDLPNKVLRADCR